MHGMHEVDEAWGAANAPTDWSLLVALHNRLVDQKLFRYMRLYTVVLFFCLSLLDSFLALAIRTR